MRFHKLWNMLLWFTALNLLDESFLYNADSGALNRVRSKGKSPPQSDWYSGSWASDVWPQALAIIWRRSRYASSKPTSLVRGICQTRRWSPGTAGHPVLPKALSDFEKRRYWQIAKGLRKKDGVGTDWMEDSSRMLYPSWCAYCFIHTCGWLTAT